MKLKSTRRTTVVCSLVALTLFFACDDSPNVVTDSDTDSDSREDDDGISLGNGGQGGSSNPDTCGGEDVEAAPVAANVLLVVDTSGSMDETPEGFTDTKWEALVASLKTALPEVQDLVSFGAKFFPSGDTEADICSVTSGVEVGVASGAASVTAITETLDALAPGGDTPTAAALGDALEYFTNGPGKDLEGQKFVLLATDGGPNCSDSPAVDCTCDGNPQADKECGERERCTVNVSAESGEACALDGDWGSCCLPDQLTLCLDDAGTLAAVNALAAAGIKTIVVGMPGSEQYTDVLDQLAVAGGLPAASTSPRYTKVEDPAGLTESLRDLTRTLIRSCDVQLEETPTDRGQVNVFLDGDVIPKDDDNGWKYANDENPPLIELTGSTCAQVEEEGVEKISVQFGCRTVVR